MRCALFIAVLAALRLAVYAEAEANYTRPPWSWVPTSEPRRKRMFP